MCFDLFLVQKTQRRIIIPQLAAANQQRERWNVTSEKSSFAAFDWTNDVFSLVRNDRTVDYVIFPFSRNLKNQNGFKIFARRFC